MAQVADPEAEFPTPSLSIVVSDPIILTEGGGGKEYAIYTIQSMSREDPSFSIPTFTTRRRFSEFQELRKLLVSRHQNLRIPALPTKCVMPCCRLKRKTIDIRVKGFQRFINGLLEVQELKKDVCLFHFVQTNRTMAEIKIIANGEVESGLGSSCSERTHLISRSSSTLFVAS